MNHALMAGLLSPVPLLLAALVAMALGWRRAAGVALAGFLALGVPAVVSLLLVSLPLPAAPGGAAPAAIVVLPGDSPDLVNPGGEEPAGNTLERLRTAAALQRRTKLPLLVTGGSSERAGTAPQAVAMAASLETDFAVPVRWTESRSRNLWQSTSASAALLRASGITRAYFVADRWDEALASRIYRRAGIELVMVPVLRPKQILNTADGLVPRAITWLEGAWAMQQWAGLACDAVAPCRSWMAEPDAPYGS